MVWLVGDGYVLSGGEDGICCRPPQYPRWSFFVEVGYVLGAKPHGVLSAKDLRGRWL